MIRVGLVDDQELIRIGVRAILAAEADIEVVVDVGDGAELIRACEMHDPPLDVALVDLRMPGLDGAAVSRGIKRVSPSTEVIVLTTFDTADDIDDALAAGATSYLLKRGHRDELLSSVRAAARGESILSPPVARHVVGAAVRARPVPLAPAAKQALARLTPREAEVFALIGVGLTNHEIGERLFLSESTIKTHVSNVLMKLDCRDRTQAALLAAHHRQQGRPGD